MRLSRSILLAAVAIGWIAPAASAQVATTYDLVPDESNSATGCTGPSPCLCPVQFVAQLEGSFDVVPVVPSLGPIFEFTIENFEVFSMPMSPVAPITIYEGSGTWVVDLAAGTQQMQLDLVVDGVPQQFESVGFVPLGADPFDAISVAVFHQINACVYDGLQLSAIPATIDPGFIRGDANQDGLLNIADPVEMLDLLFGVNPSVSCADALDANDDGGANIADPVYVLGRLFSAGPPPAAPYPDCGLDPTPDSLGCATHSACP